MNLDESHLILLRKQLVGGSSPLSGTNYLAFVSVQRSGENMRGGKHSVQMPGAGESTSASEARLETAL